MLTEGDSDGVFAHVEDGDYESEDYEEDDVVGQSHADDEEHLKEELSDQQRLPPISSRACIIISRQFSSFIAFTI